MDKERSRVHIGIEKLLKDYTEKSLFFAVHAHEEAPDMDIMAAVKWLQEFLEIE